METFYFGRLNYKSKHELFDLLTYGNKFRQKKTNNQYGIFSVEIIEDKDFGKIYTGELVKYQDIKEEPVIKEDKISIEYIRDVIQGKSRFYLIEQNHLIAYNPYGNIINPENFCKAFSGVIIGADDSFEVETLIYPINYEYEFLKFLKEMRTIHKLNLKLTPSNPESGDLWEKIDKRLQKLNAKYYKEEIEAKDHESLNIDEEIINKIHMAQDGYGKATGEGTDKDGNNVKISTNRRESILKQPVDHDLTIREQFVVLKKVFVSVVDRLRRK